MAELFKWKIDVPKLMPILKPRQFKELTDREMLKTFNTSTEHIKRNIKAKAPRGVGGILKNSIKSRTSPKFGEVFTDLSYASVIELGRRASPVSYKHLIDWVRLSPKGRRYFAALRGSNKRITLIGAAVMLSKSMKRRARKGHFYFRSGTAISMPFVNREFQTMMQRLARKAL